MSDLEHTVDRQASGLDAFLAEVAEVLGQASLLTGADCAPYEIDVAHCRGKAAAVVIPCDTHAVSALMRIAVRHRIRLVAQGNRSGLVGGAVTDNSGKQVIVSLSRMRQVREIDPLNRTVIVEAGTLLSALNRTLETHSLYFPIDIGSDPAIGGLIGANAGGSRLLKHGDVRHNLLGIEVVLADGDGTVVQLLAPLRKNNTGLDSSSCLSAPAAPSASLRRRRLSSNASTSRRKACLWPCLTMGQRLRCCRPSNFNLAICCARSK